MNIVAYEFIIWRPVLHNGKFSHNVIRREVLPAPSEEAHPAVRLKGREETIVTENLTVIAEPEYVKSVRKGQLVMREEFVADPQVPTTLVKEQQDCGSVENNGKDFISAINSVIDEASQQTMPTRAARLTAFGILTFLDGSEENFLGTDKWRVCTTDGQIVKFNHHDL